MKTLHLLITGRAQGVGFRDWLVNEATQFGLTGWVRNTEDDGVEAIISGPSETVDLAVELCRRGPVLAVVCDIRITRRHLFMANLASAGAALSRHAVEIDQGSHP